MSKAPLPSRTVGKYSRPFSDSQKKSIAAQYKKGVVLAVIAKEHDCSVAKARRILLELNVPLRSRGPKEGSKQTVKKIGDVIKSLKKVKAQAEYKPQSIKKK